MAKKEEIPEETPAAPAEIVEGEPGAGVPAVPGDAPQYLPPEELPTPRMRIIQKPSDEHPNTGVFVNNLTDEELAELKCIVLGMRRGRVLWPKVGEGDDPLCRSRDFVHGEGQPGGGCEACPLKDWGDDEKPKCAETIDFACLDEYGVPFFLQVSRTGLKPARAFIASAQYRGKPLYYSTVSITLRKATKPAPHHVPVFKRGQDIDPATGPEFEAVLKRLSAAWDRVQAEEPKDDAAAGEF
ncbi:MAG TPA: hypothetical protein VMW93_07930 [bacterium]|nr:hypothetical protein [bacterium]